MININKYLILIIIVLVAVFFFYRIGQSSYVNNQPPVNYTNLSFPTSTPKPQIFRLIQEALKRNPRPTPPIENNP